MSNCSKSSPKPPKPELTPLPKPGLTTLPAFRAELSVPAFAQRRMSPKPGLTTLPAFRAELSVPAFAQRRMSPKPGLTTLPALRAELSVPAFAQRRMSPKPGLTTLPAFRAELSVPAFAQRRMPPKPGLPPLPASLAAPVARPPSKRKRVASVVWVSGFDKAIRKAGPVGRRGSPYARRALTFRFTPRKFTRFLLETTRSWSISRRIVSRISPRNSCSTNSGVLLRRLADAQVLQRRFTTSQASPGVALCRFHRRHYGQQCSQIASGSVPRVRQRKRTAGWGTVVSGVWLLKQARPGPARR
jgi:hypothetical protein